MVSGRKILVYAEVDDGSCLQQVVDYALDSASSITVCEVVPAPPRNSDSQGVIDRVYEFRWALAFQRLRHICDRFSEHMEIDYGVFSGEPFIAITEQVQEQGFNLVVHISSFSDNDAPYATLNATGMHLMRKCPCAVWAIRAATSASNEDVVVALDRDRGPHADRAELFAQSIISTALEHAKASGGRLHIVHAWEPFGLELLDHPSLALNAEEREFYCSQQRVETETWFHALMSQFASEVAQTAPGRENTSTTRQWQAENGVKITSSLQFQKPLAAIKSVLRDTQAGLLVLGNVGSSSHPGVLIGPTTESLLAQCTVPTLALKPADYVSPLSRPPINP
ncbi:MAG: universal stress protein [Pseudomonadota bacterium]